MKCWTLKLYTHDLHCHYWKPVLFMLTHNLLTGKTMVTTAVSPSQLMTDSARAATVAGGWKKSWPDAIGMQRQQHWHSCRSGVRVWLQSWCLQKHSCRLLRMSPLCVEQVSPDIGNLPLYNALNSDLHVHATSQSWTCKDLQKHPQAGSWQGPGRVNTVPF